MPGDTGMKNRREEFENPGISYRSKPFWAWNGKLEEQELYRQLDILKEMGFGGAFIHSRVGLETEYLGQEWMELVDRCLQYGKKIGLDLWIYDEDRWPSGSAGGLVTQKKENRSKRMQMYILEAEEAASFLEKGKRQILSVFRCSLQGYEYENLERISGSSDLRETEKQNDRKDEKVLAFIVEESSPSDNYNGNTYLDTMKGRAVEEFLQETHDRYREELSEEGLSGMHGMFTDEPHRGAYLCDFSEGNQTSIPYTEELIPAFAQQFGYELADALPDIFLRKRGEAFSRAAIDYLETAQNLFLENYMEAYRDRCHRYGWDFTGHLLHEDSLSTQTCMLGSLMTGYEYMDIPGIDLLGEKNACRWIGKQVSSVAHQTGKQHMLTELFGCSGWQMRFEDYKAVGDWQAMMGIDLFCPHLSWYTMKGENKRDYPASIFYQSAWYEEYRYTEDYFARIHVLTEGKPSQCRLLVINPIRSVWARAHIGSFAWILSQDEGISRIEAQYEETFRILMEAGIDFDYGEEGLLKKYGSAQDGRVTVGECTYDKVLLSGAETLEESTWKLLSDFVSAGGRLIVAGSRPDRIRANPDERMEQLLKQAEWIPFTREAVAASCRPEKPLYTLENHGQNVYMQSYEKDGVLSFILLNIDRERAAEKVTLTIAEEGILEEWDARTGRITQLDAEKKTVQRIVTNLAPGEEKIYVLVPFTQKVTRVNDNLTYSQKTEESIGKSAVSEKNGGGDVGDLQNPEGQAVHSPERADLRGRFFSYSLSEPNVAVLDRAEVYLEGQCIVRGEEILKEDRRLRKAMGFPYRGGEMMQPWYIRSCRPELLSRERAVRAVFYFWIDELPEELEIAAEIPENGAKVSLNGRELTASEDFWIDRAYTKFKAEVLHLGENRIEMEYRYRRDSGLEAIYLLGNFAVTLEGEIHLSKLPKKLTCGSITEQGLPFYSGRILYELDTQLKEYCEQEVTVQFGELPAALAVLHGEKKERIAFRPYEAKVKRLESVEMIFNRRNTFGPLHLPLDYQGTYGPETFLTEGENWREEIQLFPQGLPESVAFIRT